MTEQVKPIKSIRDLKQHKRNANVRIERTGQARNNERNIDQR